VGKNCHQKEKLSSYKKPPQPAPAILAAHITGLRILSCGGDFMEFLCRIVVLIRVSVVGGTWALFDRFLVKMKLKEAIRSGAAFSFHLQVQRRIVQRYYRKRICFSPCLLLPDYWQYLPRLWERCAMFCYIGNGPDHSLRKIKGWTNELSCCGPRWSLR